MEYKAEDFISFIESGRRDKISNNGLELISKRFRELEHEVNKLTLDAITSWVAVSDKIPSIEKNGKKVLIYRIMNDNQECLAISIYETSMVKYCNPNETWWTELPKPPCL